MRALALIVQALLLLRDVPKYWRAIREMIDYFRSIPCKDEQKKTVAETASSFHEKQKHP